MARKGGPRDEGAGRRTGTPNRRTLEKMVEASHHVGAIRRQGQKIAVEVLNDLMQTSMSFAATYQQRIMAAGEKASAADKEWFFRAMECAGAFARALAPYQSAKYGPMPVAPPAPEVPEPKVVEGKVVRLDDPVAVARTYQQMVKRIA